MSAKKIELALSKLPEKIEKVNLLKVVRLVAKEIGLHFTTINNEDQLDIKDCQIIDPYVRIRTVIICKL